LRCSFVKLDFVLIPIVCYCCYPQSLGTLYKENVVEQCSAFENEQIEDQRRVRRAFRDMRWQEDGRWETVPLACWHLSERYAHAIRSATEGLMGACQKNRFKVSTRKTPDGNQIWIIMSLVIICFLFFKFKQIVRDGSVGWQHVLDHLDQVTVWTDLTGRWDQRSSRRRFWLASFG